MKYILLIIATILLSQSCVINPPPIDVEIETVEPDMVLNSLSLPPSVFAVLLTNSFSALLLEGDSLSESDLGVLDNFLVDPAMVTVSYNSNEIELDNLFPGFFGSLDIELIPNVDYELIVTDLSTDEELTAKTRVLPTVTIEDITYEDVLVSDSLGFAGRMTYVINDPPDEDNFYILTQERFSESSGSNVSSITDLIKTGSKFQLLQDRELIGQSGQLSYEFNTNFAKGDTITASLANITEEYYDYLVAYKRLGNIFTSILSEPIRSLPTNVEGGLGYFNLALPDYRDVVLE